MNEIKKIKKEIEFIKSTIYGALKKNNLSIKSSTLLLGEYKKQPNTIGCFKYENGWYRYDIDEKLVETFIGPFSLNGVIYSLAFKLPYMPELENFEFHDKDQEINDTYTYRSIDEIKKIAEEQMNRFFENNGKLNNNLGDNQFT